LEAGADPGFQVRGGHLKKLRRAQGGAKFLVVFRVKNHDFTPKNPPGINVYRGPSKDASYQVSIHLAKRLNQEEKIF
jgi:hypothetical protein